MGQASPPNPDPDPRNDGSISGLTVIVGLVLLVIAATAFAVATYLAMGPISLRRQAIARAVAEPEQTQEAARSGLAAPATATLEGDTSAPVGDQPASPPDTPSSATAADDSSEDTVGDAGQRPSRQADPSDLSLTQLAPIEVVGTGANAGDWRGAVTSGGLAFGRAVRLRPAEDQGVAQIAFALQARFAQLRGVAAIVGDGTRDATGASQDLPQAIFRVYGDGNLLWESGLLIGPGQQQRFQCDVRGVDVLTLVAESQSPASSSDFAWGDPTL
ncbi:MAG: NPCBM/NEW2 domain-containing protein, partial [Pirellulaceae bacterium]|nr:NPCBM/NEW2 domain-containing protein [Pirellulaceae bacterium]